MVPMGPKVLNLEFSLCRTWKSPEDGHSRWKGHDEASWKPSC